jgi:opacity protein-like surface antigen
MSYKSLALAAGLALAAFSSASAADLAPMPVKAKPIIDVPFFLVNDNRFTFAYQFTATDPGVTNKTAKQVYAYTHFDVWGYGTNFFNIDLLKSDKADPAAPCGAAFTGCAGATEIYGLIRSTFGFNELFNTHAFTMGVLHDVSIEVGADANSENNNFAVAKRDVVAGLQFAFDLPYHGYVNIAPLYYKEISHDAFTTCPPIGLGAPGNCSADGNTRFKGTWAVETGYYMDLGFLPPNLQYFAISGRAGFYGPKGSDISPLVGTPTKTEINSEPIRLTFDAGKLVWGPKYSHEVDLWVAYRYWQNKFGLDHSADGACIGAPGSQVAGSCTEKSLYSGVSVKF